VASAYRKVSARERSKKSKSTQNVDGIEFYNFETAAYLNVCCAVECARTERAVASSHSTQQCTLSSR
jgi:hypothetical protein